MKKRGFTLIELLAVIVILAIIALIATPIVMNVIENSRKGAAEKSAANIEQAAELYYYNKKLNDGFFGATFICKDDACSNGEETLNLSGTVPEDGRIVIDNQGNIMLNSIVINGYVCEQNGESYTCEKANKISESTTNGVITLNESKTTTLPNYIIKGNSVQSGEPSPETPSEIQSVGDLVTEEGPNKGKYEIPIKVTGKGTFSYSIYLDEPLRCVKGVCDEINFETGMIIRKIKTVYLKDLKWHYSDKNECFYTDKILDVISESNSRKFMNTKYLVRASIEHNSSYINYQSLYIYDKNYNNLSSFKSSLGDAKINYQLAQPEYETIPLPNININKDISNITIDTNIKPSEFIVDYYK